MTPQTFPATGSYRVRPMQNADLEAVLALDRSLPEAPHWSGSAYLAYTARREQGALQRLGWVAEAEGRLAGFVAVQVLALPPAPEAELESICVAVQDQRRGVARLLMAAVLLELKRLQVLALCLEVRGSNTPALALYTRLGFRQSGVRKAYYSDPPEDALLMNLGLNG